MLLSGVRGMKRWRGGTSWLTVIVRLSRYSMVILGNYSVVSLDSKSVLNLHINQSVFSLVIVIQW